MCKLFLSLLLPLLLFSSCGTADSPARASAPEAASVSSPAPTEPPTEAVVTADMSAGAIRALAENTALRTVTVENSREYEALAALSRALPECSISYTVSIGGTEYPSDTAELVLTDDAELETLLALLPHLRRVDLTALPVTAEQIDALEAAYPDVRFIWMVKFGSWTVRSDITCFSTLYDNGRPRYQDEQLAPLFRYCRDLVALDVGHMPIRDLTLIGGLTKLKVLIIMESYVEDISPLSNCTELMYLELFNNNYITDFSPLSALTRMEYLNVSNQPGIQNLDFIDTMPDLRCCYVIHNWMDDVIEAEVQAARPEVDFCFGTGHPTGLGWRATDCNCAIRSEFYFWRDIADFRAWDDVDYAPGREHAPFAPIYK